MGNRIWDIVLHGEALWLAYWGGRRVDVITEGNREIAHQFTGDYLPHAIASHGNAVYVLASTLNPSTPDDIRPQFVRITSEGVQVIYQPD